MSRSDDFYSEAAGSADRAGVLLQPQRGIYMAAYLASRCESLEAELERARLVQDNLVAQVGVENLEGTMGFRGGPG